MPTDKDILQTERDTLNTIASSEWAEGKFLDDSTGKKDVFGHLGARKRKIPARVNRLASICRKYGLNLADVNDGFDLSWSYAVNGSNLLLNPNAFNSWTDTFSSTSVSANVVANPIDGSVNADILIEGSGLNAFGIQSNSSGLSDNIIVRYSVYAKSNSRNWLYIVPSDKAGGTYGTSVNIGSAQFGALQSNYIIRKRVYFVNDGWCKVEFDINTSSGGITPSFEIYLMDTNDNPFYTGDGASGVVFYNAEIKAVIPVSIKNRVINALDALIAQL